MFKIRRYQYGIQFWFFNKLRIEFRKKFYFDFYKGNSSIWIDIPFVEIKIKRNYKGHFIA